MSDREIKCIEFNNYKTLMEKVVTEGWESWWQEVEERLSKITSHKEEYLAKLKTNTSNMAVFMVLYNMMRIMFTQIGKLMNNMKLYSQLYEENPDALTEIILINQVLNMILKFSVFNIEEWLKVREISIVYTKDDRFFKDFLGEGQHITKNKDFENDVKIGQMRKFYKHYTPKEISSILSKAF